MKIKEVIKKTELTDKAIRLYIENGLVAPSIDESYSGRKSIEFSDDDVERLSNIALLRKAGFSIADIKEIIESDEKAKNVVKRFIEETENNIQHETEIIEKLRSIPAENGISMKTICESLSKAVEKKQVPKEDMKLSALERTIRGFFCALGGFGMLVSVAGFVAYEIILRDAFIHPIYNSVFLPVLIYSGFILMLVLSVALLKINIGQNFSSTKKSVRFLNSAVMPISYVILLFFTFVFCFVALLGGACSKTDNPNKYLKFDECMGEDFSNKIFSAFPSEIPKSADKDSIKYFYRHTFVIDPDFDVIAEWILPEEEYNETKNAYIDKYDLSEIGNWTYYHILKEEYYSTEELKFDLFKKKDWNFDDYRIIIVAFNDKENKVRYIASNAMDPYSEGPYFLNLEW